MATVSTSKSRVCSVKQSVVTPKEPSHFYAHMWPSANGGSYATGIYPNLATAKARLGFGRPVEGEEENRGFKFVPLTTECRFRAFQTSWQPDFSIVYRTLVDGEPNASERQEQEHKKFTRLLAELEQPRHLLEIPPGGINGEYTHVETDFVTREEGFAYVGEQNREAIEQHGDVRAEHWYVLVESGDPMPGPTILLDIKQGCIGEEIRHVLYPVRLAIPTADEIKRFGNLLVSKGGAA